MDVKNALSMLETHVSKHSNNKYQNSPINNDHALKQPVFTVLTAEKYMTRYLAQSGEKQAQTEDLLKACHFLLFEIQNRLNEVSSTMDMYECSACHEIMHTKFPITQCDHCNSTRIVKV